MQAPGHALTNTALAVVAENLSHVAGPALLFSQASHITPSLLTLKCVFYGALILPASLPDSDQRLGLKHRGVTHSIIGLLVFTGGLFGLLWLATSFLSTQALALPETVSRILLIALPLSCLLHILGDLITVRGVRLFWPSQTFIRIVPKVIAIKNQHSSEYLVVGTLVLATCFLLVLQVFGV